MDPLSLVRDFNVGKKIDRIRIEGDDVNFDGQYVFPKKTFTAFRAARDYCTLEVVLYVLNTRALAQPDYLRQAAASSLDVLSFIERRKLLEILDGKVNLQLDAGPAIPTEPADGDDIEQAAKRAKIDGPAASLQEERFHRQLRDRNTMLLAPQKEFKLVLDVANRAHMQLSNLFKQQQQQAAAAKQAQAAKEKAAQAAAAKQAAAPAPAPAPTKPTGRFDRDNTADALKAMGGDAAMGLNQVINMYGAAGNATAANGSGLQGPAQPPPPPPPPPTQPPPQKQPSSHSKAPPSSSQQQRHKYGASAPAHHAKSTGGRVPAPVSAPSDPLQGAVPIIIVPSGMTAMINMYNARQFLEEGRFESSNAAASSGQPKPTTMTIKRTALKPPGKTVPYLVTDKPPDKKDTAMWARVVAVIVQGAKWQFKDWPMKGAAQGDLVETFMKVAGFYIHFSDDKVPEVVTGWNVRRLGLARERRHMDSPVMLDFYTYLDAFLSARKSPLAY